MNAYTWPLKLHGTCTLMDGRTRRVSATIEGAGDAKGAMLSHMLRLPRAWEWYGCGVEAITPLGQRVSIIVEPLA